MFKVNMVNDVLIVLVTLRTISENVEKKSENFE